MKFLWRLWGEIKANVFSTTLIITQICFSIICYGLVVALTQNFMDSSAFFHKNYNENSVKVHAQSFTEKQVSQILSAANADRYILSDFYFSENKMDVFIESVNEQAFDIADDFIVGENVDIYKDYGGALPCIASSTLAQSYKVGKTYNIGGIYFYICGNFENNNIFYMTNTSTGSAFFMVYDKENILSESVLRHINSSLFIRSDGNRENAFEKIESLGLNVSCEEFEPKSQMQKEFRSVSGILIIGVWITIISVIGILANNLLTYHKNEQSYVTQMCVGAKKRDIIILYIVRISLCMAASIPVSTLVSKAIFMRLGVVGNTEISMVIAIAAAVLISAVSLAVIAGRLRKVHQYC